MDDLQYGTRNKRGDFTPKDYLESPPFWQFPPQISKVFGWIIGYIWPWNLVALLTALAWWKWVIPDMATMKTLSASWIAPLLIANWVGIFLFFGFFEWRYYLKKVQDRRFKYNSKFPSEQPSDVFWFKSQNLDNFLRSFLISIPLGTAIEVSLLWGYANGLIASVDLGSHFGYVAFLCFLAPIVHEVHFFFIHITIHQGALYKWVHAIHHNSVNPSPWSSLSMHPVEGFAYFGVAFWVLAVASHPFVAVLFFHLAGFGAIVGHLGFEKLEVTEQLGQKSSAYSHYLHHKFFEVNYCDNGTFPLDKWFGTWHDGSPAGEQRMQERFNRKKAKMNASS